MASAPRCTTPSRNSCPWREGDWIHRIPRALAALGDGLYNPIECFRAVHVQLQSSQGNIVTLCKARLRKRDTCRLTVPYAAARHGHHGPHHRIPSNDDPWPGAVRQCLHQGAKEHLHYCGRQQGPTDHPGWREALVNMFRTTGAQDCRLRLVHPARARQDAHRGPRVTPDGLHLHVDGAVRATWPSQRAEWHATRQQPTWVSSTRTSSTARTRRRMRTWRGPSQCAHSPMRPGQWGW